MLNIYKNLSKLQKKLYQISSYQAKIGMVSVGLPTRGGCPTQYITYPPGVVYKRRCFIMDYETKVTLILVPSQYQYICNQIVNQNS